MRRCASSRFVLIHLALAASRNNDTIGLLAPIVLAAPLAAHFPAFRARDRRGEIEPVCSRSGPVPRTIALPATAGSSPEAAGAMRPEPMSAGAAVETLKASGARRVFNDYDLGGYLIYAGMPTFIDGRSELYGRDFLLRYFNDPH